MIRIHLPEDEAQRLEQAFRQATDRKYRTASRSSAWPTGAAPHQDIAADLGITPRTVQRWLNAYLERGLDGLRPRKAKGRRPKIPADLAEEVRRWVIEGPAKQGLDRANWTHEELADHLLKTHGIRTSRSAMQRFCRKLGIRPYRPTYRYLRGDPEKQAQAREDLAELKKKAEAGELVLLSQDEARFPMVPTLAATLGVKGHRPVVGTRDCKDLLYVFGRGQLVTGALHANTLESPARRQAEDRPEQDAADAGGVRRPPAARRPALPGREAQAGGADHRQRPVAPGQPVDEALAENPHLEFKRLPSYSPQLNVIERFWKVLRRRATHNRLFDTPGRPEAVAPEQPVLLPDGAAGGCEA